MYKLEVPPLRWGEKLADALMLPLMYVNNWLGGIFFESTQGTHFWNNKKYHWGMRRHIRPFLLKIDGDPLATQKRYILGIPRFHIPWLFGWRKYVVLEPIEYTLRWHPGWLAPGLIGVSRKWVQGNVKLLRGPNEVGFFGVAEDGSILRLREVARGRLGNRGPYRKVPLL